MRLRANIIQVYHSVSHHLPTIEKALERKQGCSSVDLVSRQAAKLKELLVCFAFDSRQPLWRPSPVNRYVSAPTITSRTIASMLNPQASTFSIGESQPADAQRSKDSISGMTGKKKTSGNVKVLADREVAGGNKVMMPFGFSSCVRADTCDLLLDTLVTKL